MAEEAIPTEQAIPPVVELIDGLTPEHNGCCLLPDGTIHAW
jgi:hypothetical protein